MSNKRFSWKGFLSFISYVAVVCIGISLLLGQFISSIAGAFNTVASILAFTVTAFTSFSFARSRNHWAYYLVWVICVVLIVVLMIL